MELLDHPAYDTAKFVQDCNDRFAALRRASWQDYLDGQAYLEWMFEFTAFDAWHKVRFQAQVMAKRVHVDFVRWPLWEQAIPKIADSCADDKGLVFINDVGLVKCPQGVIPTLVRAQFPANLHRFIAL